MNRERIALADYTRTAVANWHAENYAPEQWAELARAAGMKYVILTTRHHDGFAVWDSATNAFNAAKYGPKRDLVAPFVEAVRGAGLRVGLYYSPAAWSHPDYPGACYREWPSENDWASEAARHRFIDFYRQELRELLTGYGKIDLLWYDGCIPENIDGAATNAMLRQWQPEILISPRNGEPSDFSVCEQAIKPAPPGRPWEACLTLRRDTWGYHRGDPECKTPKQVIEMLATTAGGAGNLLLNVGPQPDGIIPPAEVQTLRTVGAWLAQSGEWLYGSERSPFSWNNSAKVTVKGTRAYLHFLSEPGSEFRWAECANRVLAAKWLATGAAIKFTQDLDGVVKLENLPQPLSAAPVTTAVLELDGAPRALTPQTAFWIPG
jgi:alpha-L-fucosidase